MGFDNDRDNSRNGGFLDRLADALENRFIMVIVASMIGVGVVKMSPDARNYPFTGTMGDAVKERLRDLEHRQALDDEHRSEAALWKERIRELEKLCSEYTYRMKNLEKKVGG